MNEKEEQAKLRADLIARYGERIFKCALEMSGIRCCLQALATDALSAEERQQAYMRAGMHLANLHASFMTTGESAQFTECARLIDAAFEMWALDALEAACVQPDKR